MVKYIIVGVVIVLAIALIGFILKKKGGGGQAGRGAAPPPPMPQTQGTAQPGPTTTSPPASRRHGAPAAGQAAAGPKINWLVGRRGAVQGKTFHIGERRVTLGRGVSNFVQVVDDQVSRVHCQLVATPTGLQIKDLASKTGTLVNGQKIDEYVLQNGDQIEIGDTILEYWLHGNFAQNAALEKKESGEEARMATQAVDLAGDMKQVAAKAVQAHGGDVRAAAASLGVSAEFLMQMLDTKR